MAELTSTSISSSKKAFNFPEDLAGGGYLYVSRGTGVWGPPIRFLAPPEITIIDLLPDHAATIKN